MRPGIEHIVFTLDNSIVIGSHFISEVNLERSMYSGLREHCWGRSSTNAEHHVASEVVLSRILEFYYDILEKQAMLRGRCLHSTQLDISDRPLSGDDLAALIAMVLDPKTFTPQEVSLGNSGSLEPLVRPDSVHEDRRRAKFLACYLLEAIPWLFDAVYAQRMSIPPTLTAKSKCVERGHLQRAVTWGAVAQRAVTQRAVWFR